MEEPDFLRGIFIEVLLPGIGMSICPDLQLRRPQWGREYVTHRDESGCRLLDDEGQRLTMITFGSEHVENGQGL